MIDSRVSTVGIRYNLIKARIYRIVLDTSQNELLFDELELCQGINANGYGD